MWIRGQWREGSSELRYLNQNPFNGDPLTEIKLANQSDIDEAYKSSFELQKEWESVSAFEKAQVIERAAQIVERRKDEIIRLLIEELGSSHGKAHFEINSTILCMKEAATYPFRMRHEILPSIIPGKENRVLRVPVGVVGVIAPWNVPFHLAMRSVVAALAAGNGVVLKPDIQTFISGGILLAQIFEEAGIPAGLFNLVISDLREIGDAFIEHPIPNMISFTGSTAAGKHITAIAAQQLKKASLELGGNSAFIVLDDADIEQAASAAIFGKFVHQGQICMSINRIIVDRKVYSQFIEVFKGKLEKVKVGDPMEPDTFIGPMINQKQIDRILKLVHKSVDEGAQLIVEGNINGNLMEPFILIDATNDMTIAQTEIFGPVAVIIPVESEEEAIQAANGTPYGLSGSVFTSSIERGLRVAKQIRTGMIHINDQSVNDEPHIAFGGEKHSGLGRFGGEWSLEEFTTLRWISIQESPRHFPF
ncbi:aldehyde dehydrogenase family protein [Paenibacillus sediminis]|nr:aldehyde dehydrogenase family protein [Paenibacillus sediminis]